MSNNKFYAKSIFTNKEYEIIQDNGTWLTVKDDNGTQSKVLSEFMTIFIKEERIKHYQLLENKWVKCISNSYKFKEEECFITELFIGQFYRIVSIYEDSFTIEIEIYGNLLTYLHPIKYIERFFDIKNIYSFKPNFIREDKIIDYEKHIGKWVKFIGGDYDMIFNNFFNINDLYRIISVTKNPLYIRISNQKDDTFDFSEAKFNQLFDIKNIYVGEKYPSNKNKNNPWKITSIKFCNYEIYNINNISDKEKK